MLSYLKIKNFALIDELYVEFEKGLNVITGETGAGKSMVIEAIKVILGSPINQNWIKDEKETLVVEALFDLDPLTEKQLPYLQKYGQISFQDEQLIIRREIDKNRRNRCFINNQLVPLFHLQEIGNYLIDLHGQHTHQSLLNPKAHIEFVDSFGNRSFSEKKEQLSLYYRQWQHKGSLLKQMIEQYSESVAKEEYFQFQLKEIEQAKLKEGEDRELEEILNIIRHKAKIKEIMEMANGILFEGSEKEESPVYDILTRLITNFNTIAHLDQNINNIKAQLTEIQLKVEDISSQIMDYNEKIDLDVYQLQEMEERLNIINNLKHKYGSQIKEILEYYDHLQKQLNSLEDNRIKIDKLTEELREYEKILIELSLALSNQRQKIAQQLENDILGELSELNMKDCVFQIKVEQQEDKNGVQIGNQRFKISARGIDKIEFFIATNLGEKVKPLAEIISGGEVSRIMLGLKSILSKVDQIPTMIFDEIDSGVGARLGEIIAQKLAHITQDHQVIAVTHLPQIACQANQHLYINKYTTQNKTIITMKKLMGEEQLYEIARMLDGEKYGSISIEHARRMLQGKREDGNEKEKT